MTDPLGRTTTITYPADSPNKTPLAVSTPSGRTVTYEYDLAWNKIAETLAPNTSEAAKTKFAHDKANRILSVQDPLGKITKAAYDKRGRVLTPTDPLARVTAFEYDLAGNVVTTTRPDKAVEKTGYDALNRVLTSTDAAGQTTVYSYAR
jgi:YD repeat-containing protein